MNQIKITGPTGEKTMTLGRDRVSVGRSKDNDIVLADFSVSRHHAYIEKAGEEWIVEDNQSTNGIFVNGQKTARGPFRVGDELTIGNFKIELTKTPFVSTSGTFVRSLSDFQMDFLLDPGAKTPQAAAPLKPGEEQEKRSKMLTILVRMARTLLTTTDLDGVLNKIMDVLFDALPADRAYILLKIEGLLEPKLVRSRTGPLSKEELPFSRTICDQVVNQKVSLITHDALADARFEEGKSIRIHQIRAAMCAPLWNQDNVIGMVYVDSPTRVGTFSLEDLDILTALANLAAVALERAMLTKSVEDEKRIKTQLARYHSPAIVDEIVKGKERTTSVLTASSVPDLTLLFADIVGFTTMCEKIPLEKTTETLNQFFSIAAECIFDHEGTLDKFIGACVMAFFGAPMPQKDHPDRGLAAAMDLQRRIAAWNRDRAAAGQPPILLRVGVHTGPAIVGDFGSMRRLEYTALGTTVNVTSRLEEHVAEPGKIVISEQTKDRLKGTYNLSNMGQYALKGLAAKINVYQVAWEE